MRICKQWQDQQSERELILNTIAVEAGRKVHWEQYAAQLMADYNIMPTDVEEQLANALDLITA